MPQKGTILPQNLAGTQESHPQKHYNGIVRISEFDYELPPELIAQEPSKDRQASRLMVVEKASGRMHHLRFSEIRDVLSSEHLVVLNNTKVFPARLFAEGKNKPIEVLLIRDLGSDTWEALIKPGKKARVGRRLVFVDGKFEAFVVETSDSPIRTLKFVCEGTFWKWVDRLGHTPLPPYIRRGSQSDLPTDRTRYQTVFAKFRGSIAAPTAGLHFTSEILAQLRHCFLTLHVGYGTFQPVSSTTVEDHRMHAEHYLLDRANAGLISTHLEAQKPVVAVGTTTTRTLEHIYRQQGAIVPHQGWTDLFIYPGFQFQAVQGLLTNFHLPGSTLLLLVSAFGSRDLIQECYRKAIELKYRFYSYGDAMLLI